jgi:hypothetical protein
MTHSRSIGGSKEISADLALEQTMAVPRLDGPHSLSTKSVERTVTRKMAGVYVLSAMEGGIASPRLVGRSDHDVGTKLKDGIGLYSHFAFVYASSPRSAYEMECEIYHSTKPPENATHPTKPADATWECPVCGQC